MATATELMKESWREDRRRIRAHMITSLIMQKIDPILDRADDGYIHRDVYDAIVRLMSEIGVDVITDSDRAREGLPPRDNLGWTSGELAALELARLDLITRPIVLPKDSK